MATDYKTALAVIDVLAEQFPQCFSVFEKRRRPLKLGIHTDILAASDIPPTTLSAALRTYCGNRCYLEASKEGTPRIDLNGNVVGSVTKDEADNARQRLERTKQKRNLADANVAHDDAASPTKAEKRAARNADRVSLADLRAAAQARRDNQRREGDGLR